MSKEHSYAYEAGYRDGAINYELDHCPACKNVADLQEALDENAKLRELVAQRTAKCVVVSNHETDHATGHCACGACGGAIDFWDKWCRHCGARMEGD